MIYIIILLKRCSFQYLGIILEQLLKDYIQITTNSPSIVDSSISLWILVE